MLILVELPALLTATLLLKDDSDGVHTNMLRILNEIETTVHLTPFLKSFSGQSLAMEFPKQLSPSPTLHPKFSICTSHDLVGSCNIFLHVPQKVKA